MNVPKHRRHGRYRKQTFSVFDYGEYLQRNRIEAFMSMFKRRFGSAVKSRNVKCQKMEIFMRVIAFNVDQMLRNAEKVILIFFRITRVS
jgi:transposase